MYQNKTAHRCQPRPYHRWALIVRKVRTGVGQSNLSNRTLTFVHKYCTTPTCFYVPKWNSAPVSATTVPPLSDDHNKTSAPVSTRQSQKESRTLAVDILLLRAFTPGHWNLSPDIRTVFNATTVIRARTFGHTDFTWRWIRHKKIPDTATRFHSTTAIHARTLRTLPQTKC